MSYLYKLYIVVEDDSNPVSNQDSIDEIIEKSCFGHLDIDIVGSVVCDLDNSTCGKCSKCGAWVSDHEKPDHIDGFSDGCILDGEWVCDLCVPKSHPRHF